MSTSSIDTLLATSIMIVVVLSSILGVFVVVRPYLNTTSYATTDTGYQLAKFLLLNTGRPVNWGTKTESLTDFGLARSGDEAVYELDVDKISRLNQNNFYHLSFKNVSQALGIPNRPFQIKINPVINMTINLTSYINEGLQTKYCFAINSRKLTLPVDVDLRYYTILNDYIQNGTFSVSASSTRLLEISLPNNLSGSALLVIFGKAESQIVTYAVYSFIHNMDNPSSLGGKCLGLSPINYTLRVEKLFENETLLGATVFTYDYCFNLRQISTSGRSTILGMPQLQDISPMVIVVTGFNQSASFAEWVAYPQLPLTFGPDFTGENDIMNSVSFYFLVTINHVIWECKILVSET